MKRLESLRIRAKMTNSRKMTERKNLSESVQKLCETLDLLADILSERNRYNLSIKHAILLKEIETDQIKRVRRENQKGTPKGIQTRTIDKKEERKNQEYKNVTQTKIAQKNNTKDNQTDFVLH